MLLYLKKNKVSLINLNPEYLATLIFEIFNNKTNNPLSKKLKSELFNAFLYKASFSKVDKPGPDGKQINIPFLKYFEIKSKFKILWNSIL